MRGSSWWLLLMTTDSAHLSEELLLLVLAERDIQATDGVEELADAHGLADASLLEELTHTNTHSRGQ